MMIRILAFAFIALCAINQLHAGPVEEKHIHTLAADLNGDGQAESIVMEYARDLGEFTLEVNDSSVESWLQPSLYGCEIVDLDINDGMKEILIPTMGPSDDPECLIYAYDGEGIIDVGHTSGYRNIKGDGVMYTRGWRGFWTATDKWVLNPDTHQIEKTPQDLYFVEEPKYHKTSPAAHWVNEPFPLYYNSRSDRVVEVAEAGSIVYILACKPTCDEFLSYDYDGECWFWYLIKSDTGILGWAREWDFIHNIEGGVIAD